jgi:hypothetical protein
MSSSRRASTQAGRSRWIEAFILLRTELSRSVRSLSSIRALSRPMHVSNEAQPIASISRSPVDLVVRHRTWLPRTEYLARQVLSLSPMTTISCASVGGLVAGAAWLADNSNDSIASKASLLA